MKRTIKFYIAIFLRRLHYFLAVFGLIAVSAITVSRILPATYDSQARLLVESSVIPDALAAPTVTTDSNEQLQVIQQRLMTRANLLDIARKLNVFPDISSMSADSVVAQMKSSTQIRLLGGRNQATLMTISFTASRGDVAANVVNEYVTLVMKDNISLRTGNAKDTLDFFQVEVSRLEGELQKQSAKILEFKNKNADALPDSLAFRLQQQSTLQERLTTAERDFANLADQRARIVQIFNATGRLDPSATNQVSPEQQRLADLENELSRASAVYSPENPKIKILNAQIATLKSSLGSQAQPSDSGVGTILDVQLAQMDSRSAQLELERTDLKKQLAALADSIARTPANSIVLDSLTRDYSNVQMQYNAAVDRLAKAATGERIELLSKGQRIAILDSATVPNEPSSPNRTRIAMLGIGAGLASGLGLIVLLELLNTAIRRPVDITRGLGITPIATIPYVRTPMELVVRRGIFTFAFVLVAVALPAALYAIHTYYLPLDLLFEKVAGKFSKFL